MTTDFDRLATDTAYWYRHAPEGATHARPLDSRAEIVWYRYAGGLRPWQVWLNRCNRWSPREGNPGGRLHTIARPEPPASYEGCRVRYVADTPRKGWTGDVIDEVGSRILVVYDNGRKQWYSRKAITGEPRYYEEGVPYIKVYLKVIEDEAMPKVEYENDVPAPDYRYKVQGVKGGPSVEFEQSERAHEYARQKAKDSKSGQAYRVYTAVAEYQREEPPVVRRELE